MHCKWYDTRPKINKASVYDVPITNQAILMMKHVILLLLTLFLDCISVCTNFVILNEIPVVQSSWNYEHYRMDIITIKWKVLESMNSFNSVQSTPSLFQIFNVVGRYIGIYIQFRVTHQKQKKRALLKKFLDLF